MKLELSPGAIDTMHLALQATIVSCNTTMAELRAAAGAAQQAEKAARIAAGKIAAAEEARKQREAPPHPVHRTGNGADGPPLTPSESAAAHGQKILEDGSMVAADTPEFPPAEPRE